MQVFTTTSHSLIPQEAVYQKSLRCEVGKVVKFRGEKKAELSDDGGDDDDEMFLDSKMAIFDETQLFF